MTHSFKKSADLLAILSEEAEILEVTLLDLLLQVVHSHAEGKHNRSRTVIILEAKVVKQDLMWLP